MARVRPHARAGVRAAGSACGPAVCVALRRHRDAACHSLPLPLPLTPVRVPGGIFALYAVICRAAGIQHGSQAVHEADLSLSQYTTTGAAGEEEPAAAAWGRPTRRRRLHDRAAEATQGEARRLAAAVDNRWPLLVWLGMQARLLNPCPLSP